ncbi:hypothetical protein JBE04_16100 [Streptomyces sp. PRKS01-29]|nr:hypothetical protein [Streptomyces sabulosicollis]MBI0295949.1 hypothetical protein [Streptomyces sabulosicollis]
MKFALEAVSDSMRRALGPLGVRMVVVEPGAAGKPRTRYTIGRDAALITRLSRVLPDRVLDRVLKSGLRSTLPEGSHGVRPRFGWIWPCGQCCRVLVVR